MSSKRIYFHGQLGGKDLYTPVKRLMLLTEIIAVSSYHRVKHIIIVCVGRVRGVMVLEWEMHTANRVTERLNSAMYGRGWKVTL